MLGLPVGSALEDLGSGMRSQVGTSYGTDERGPRYLETAEGYVLELGLDVQSRIIGYRYIRLDAMVEMIGKGAAPDEAFRLACGVSGRFNEAVQIIDPRRE